MIFGILIEGVSELFGFDPQPVRNRLDHLVYLTNEIREISTASPERTHDGWRRMQKYALERLLWLTIEAVTDIGTMLLDGIIMRDAGSYEEIIQILALENAISPQVSEPLRKWVKLRQVLQGTSYQESDQAENPLQDLNELPLLLLDFHVEITMFLQKELGPFQRKGLE